MGGRGGGLGLKQTALVTLSDAGLSGGRGESFLSLMHRSQLLAPPSLHTKEWESQWELNFIRSGNNALHTLAIEY